MMSTEAKTIYAAFDRLDAALDRIAEIPPDELTFEEKLTLWAQLERLRLKLAKPAS
ncbi:MAG: hypothetical protein WB785_07740 [Mycobacterium sp.]|uniref:hypothetical protein n=1 Tax=Mycobacterium sp. TaxID=1785 RepID=UPI003C3A37D0